MRRILAIIRTNCKIVSLSTVGLLAAASPSYAQPRGAGEMSAENIELLNKLRPLVPTFRAALQGDNEDAQRATLAIIADIPPSLAAGTQLDKALTAFLLRDHKDPEVIALGIRSLGRSFPDPADLAKVLPKYDNSEHKMVRQAVAEAIGSAVENSAPSNNSIANSKMFIEVANKTIPVLGHVLEDSDSGTQKLALKAMRSISRVVNDLYTFGISPLGLEIDPKAEPEGYKTLAPLVQGMAKVAPKLAVPLGSQDAATRASAARTLESLATLRLKINERRGPGVAKDDFTDVWAQLRPLLDDRVVDANSEVRLASVEALESLGEAVEARAIMRRATSDSSPYVRWAAARALGKSASSTADANSAAPDVDALAKLVDDHDIDVRTAALVSLAKFGIKAKSATPKVLTAAKQGDTEPRVVAIKALGAIESEADSSIPILIEGLKSRDDRLKIAAASGLVRFGPGAKQALPELREAIQSKNSDVRIAAAEAILAIELKPRMKDV